MESRRGSDAGRTGGDQRLAGSDADRSENEQQTNEFAQEIRHGG